VDPGPELGDLELRGGKRAVGGQADLGQAGRAMSGFMDHQIHRHQGIE
jgi:hypothetical protein